VDRPTTGREHGFGKGAPVNPILRKVREGWGTQSSWLGQEEAREGGAPGEYWPT
jgi:hypothetical protein